MPNVGALVQIIDDNASHGIPLGDVVSVENTHNDGFIFTRITETSGRYVPPEDYILMERVPEGSTQREIEMPETQTLHIVVGDNVRIVGNRAGHCQQTGSFVEIKKVDTDRYDQERYWFGRENNLLYAYDDDIIKTKHRNARFTKGSKCVIVGDLAAEMTGISSGHNVPDGTPVEIIGFQKESREEDQPSRYQEYQFRHGPRGQTSWACEEDLNPANPSS